MSRVIEVRVPDLGDFHDVDVVEVLVAAGDPVSAGQSLITLESDKASMDIPSTHAGRVESLGVSVGDKVSEGAVILTVAVDDTDADGDIAAAVKPEPAPAAANRLPKDPPDALRPFVELRAQGERKTPHDSGGSALLSSSKHEPVEAWGGVLEQPAGAGPAAEAPSAARAPAPARGSPAADVSAEVLVLGAGPGGYTAAFRAADLGKRTVLVERYPTLGGVCLNVGCIPSKALLHAARVIADAAYFEPHGIRFGRPDIDVAALARWKDGVVSRLARGLAHLARQRQVTVLTGVGRFAAPHRLEVATENGVRSVAFDHAVIAAGSRAADVPGLSSGGPRLMHSTGALRLDGVPARLLVIGGGIIGLELATVYAALGARVTIVEATGGLMPGCDRDLVRPLERRIQKAYEGIHLETQVASMEPDGDGVRVSLAAKEAPRTERFDKVLVAVGRRANGHEIGAENAGVDVGASGVIAVDAQQRTNVAHIFAIGDIAGEPMLAHKATHQGKVAAEVIAGLKSGFDARAIPSVAYTDPEIAWVGVTETDAKLRGLDYGTGVFPWAASGRALAMGREEGLTKIVFDRPSGRVIGGGIVGLGAGDLISELTLAVEMGADAEDLGLTIHPHPTLSETIGMAAEVFTGTITDLYAPRK
jgi:dihydrolipoamide dehydrogenase